MYPVERDRTKARVCRRSLGGKQEVGGEVGNSVRMAAAKKTLGCSKTTNSAALRAELGIYALSKQRHEKTDMEFLFVCLFIYL